MAIGYVDIPEWCEHCGVYSHRSEPHLRDCPLTVLEDFARVVEAIELALAVQAYGEDTARAAIDSAAAVLEADASGHRGAAAALAVTEGDLVLPVKDRGWLAYSQRRMAEVLRDAAEKMRASEVEVTT